MNILILEDEQRNFNRLRRQLEGDRYDFSCGRTTGQYSGIGGMATNPSDSGSYTCGHTPVRWTKF